MRLGIVELRLQEFIDECARSQHPIADGATFQREEVDMDPRRITHLKLTIVPNKGGSGVATLTSLQLLSAPFRSADLPGILTDDRPFLTIQATGVRMAAQLEVILWTTAIFVADVALANIARGTAISAGS